MQDIWLIKKQVECVKISIGGSALENNIEIKNLNDSILPLPLQLLKLPFKNIIRVLIPKYEKASILSIQKKYFSNHSWWILCEYYFILIKPTGSNRFLFSGIIAKAYLKYWNILWGQEELDCIFLVSSLHTRYYHYW